MLKFAVIVLVILTLILPVLAIMIIIDKNRKSVLPLLIGGAAYTFFEACIILPVINLIGYNMLFEIVGIIVTEVLRYMVLRIYLKKKGQSTENILFFFTGYAAFNLFVVWGIDALAIFAVVFFDDFRLITAGEIWIGVATAIIRAAMLFGYTILTAAAIFKKKWLYVLAAIGLHVISDENIIFELCGMINLGSGAGIVFLAAIACLTIIFAYKYDYIWKGINNHEN